MWHEKLIGMVIFIIKASWIHEKTKNMKNVIIYVKIVQKCQQISSTQTENEWKVTDYEKIYSIKEADFNFTQISLW